MTALRSFVAAGLVVAVASLIPAPALAGPHAATRTFDVAGLLSPSVVFSTWDADHNKTLSPEEFNAGWARMERVAALRQLRVQFDAHDRNRSGTIEPAEYATLELVRKAGASAPPIAGFDGDRSGALDFKEYVAMVSAVLGKGAQPK
jgi:hypothetical protein